MELLAVCAKGERAADFGFVVRALESDDDVLRVLAMELMANVDTDRVNDFETGPGHIY